MWSHDDGMEAHEPWGMIIELSRQMVVLDTISKLQSARTIIVAHESCRYGQRH